MNTEEKNKHGSKRRKQLKYMAGTFLISKAEYIAPIEHLRRLKLNSVVGVN